MNSDAVLTMESEIKGQSIAIPQTLRSAYTELESAAAILKAKEVRIAVSVGIGDSHLVGLLYSEISNLGLQIIPVKSSEIITLENTHPLCFVNSISGYTSVTVAACKYLKDQSRYVIGLTDSEDSPIALNSEKHIRLPIPRYAPDAKVPGTITVTVFAHESGSRVPTF